MSRLASFTPLLLVFVPLGCDGQQYANPDTVALVVSSESSGTERVHRCHFVPILRGSLVKARYQVEDDLKVTISVTRDDVRLDYEQSGQAQGSYLIGAEAFEGEAQVVDEDAPDGYRVELSSPCDAGDY